ncbi:MAG: hypothetical protein ACU0DH_06645 [Paracoccus sp. (in: a-proteobacteria)]|uniref:hypothetical protein n=1 Tax=Paracoccus sp. TaxID=267 RepID=UPI0040599FA1
MSDQLPLHERVRCPEQGAVGQVPIHQRPKQARWCISCKFLLSSLTLVSRFIGVRDLAKELPQTVVG